VSEFLQDLARYDFLQRALLAGLLSSVACGVVGSYVVVRRVSYIAGGISHCVLGGIGAALFLRAALGWGWLTPLYGAALAALAAAAIIGLVSLRARQREDTVIGAVWAIGMAVGVLLIARTPGYGVDPLSYLFGNILMVTPEDLWLIAGLDLLVLLLAGLFYNQLLAVCFDEEFARLRGLPVEAYYLLLLGLTALTVVVLVKVVGIVLVIALLTLPAAIAGEFARTLRQMMLATGGLCAVFTAGGLALSYTPDLPAGATIIVLAGATYLLTTVATAFRWRRQPQAT